MTSEKLSTEIAVLERKSKEAKNATVKKLLDKKIATLREELKKEADAIGKLSKAKKKVREMTQADFNEYIKMLSKKDGYSFLKSMTKDEIKRDIQRVAKPVGWRFRGNNAKKPTKKDVKEGNDVYFENRVNRSDVSRTVKLAKGGGVGQLPKSLQRRIDSLDGRLDITKEKALEAYRLHIDKGYGGSGVGYELFNAKNQKESKTFGDLAIDLGKFYSENKYAKGGGVGEYTVSEIRNMARGTNYKLGIHLPYRTDFYLKDKSGRLGNGSIMVLQDQDNKDKWSVSERKYKEGTGGYYDTIAEGKSKKEAFEIAKNAIGSKYKYAEGGVVWEVNDVSKAKYLGVLEFQDNDGEYHNFEVMETDERLVFGGYTNSGFIESGYIEKDGNSTDETLQELLADLETYYNDGEKYTSSIVVNQRMATGGSVTDGDFGAEKAGQRRSRKYSTIEIKSGGEYTRRNANQYGKAKGGRNYTENRDNRSDKRRWMEDGGSVNEGLFGEPHRLETSDIMKRGGAVGNYPELSKIAEKIADETASKINSAVASVSSKMPYKAQWVLEEVIKDLQSRV